MALPPAAANQAFCNVSAIEGGRLTVQLDLIVCDAAAGEMEMMPALCFMIQHSEKPEKFLFDLGIRRDWENYPPSIQNTIKSGLCTVDAEKDCLQSLADGGTSPSDIDYVGLSHCHWDHIGDTQAFTKSVFVVAEGCRSLFDRSYPEDPDSWYASDLLPVDRTRYLPVTEWKPIGPFPFALDFYGDGSLYIVDSPGQGTLIYWRERLRMVHGFISLAIARIIGRL